MTFIQQSKSTVTRATLKSLLLASAVSFVTVPAHAQTQAAASSSGAIEEILVTALKRATNLQETPIAISAVSGEALSNMGAGGISDYVKAVPGLSLVDGGPGQRRLVIRGIQGVGEAQVGLYYDETPVTGSPGTSNDSGARQPDLFLFDVDRIEVLRGPQGTLYGGGSMGGTVRILFKKPNLTDYEGAVDGTLQSLEHGGMGYKINGMVNVPLVEEKLAARAVLYYNEQDGYIDSPTLGNNINDDETWGGRFLVRLQPTDNFTIDASAHIQRTKAYVAGWDSSAPQRYQSSYMIDMSTKDDSEIYNLTLNWDVGFGTLTAVTSYYNRDTSVPLDTSFFMGTLKNPANCGRIVNGDPAAGCSPDQTTSFNSYVDSFVPSGLIYEPQDVNNWTNEIRLSSNGETALNWTFGVFTEKRKSYIVSAQYKIDPVSGKRISPYTETVTAATYQQFVNGTETDTIVTSRNINDTLKQKAAFGEVSYDFTDQFTVTGGARYFDYDKDIVGETTKGFDLLGAALTPPTAVVSSENGWIFKLHAAYKPNDDITIYAQAAEGFRPGGANQVIGLPGALTPYDSDSLRNYEIGIKSAWLDNRLVANISGYWIDWKDMQVAGRTANNAFAFISNAGQARIKGVEFEILAQPIDGWTIGVTGDYRTAKLTKDQLNPDLSANLLSLGRAGDRIPYVAKFSTTLTSSYVREVGNDMNFMIRGDVSYVGPSYSEFRPTYVFYERNPSHTLVGARTGVEGIDGDWGVYLFVNNLLNADGIVRRNSSSFGYDINFSAQPRTIGLNAKKNF